MRTAIRSDIGASVLRYLVAVWTVGLAFAATLLMSPLVPPGISPLFLLAVMISAWRGGSGAGLLATALSALASAFVFLPPTYSLRIDRDDLLQLAVFTFAAVIIGTLSAARRRAEDEREALLVREQVARVEAERANAVKDEFLAAVSHELRTPLTTIKTLTRVMQRRDPGEAERREYLEDIASECDRQIDLVHNLLDLSRIRAGGVQIRPQRVDAAESSAPVRRSSAPRRKNTGTNCSWNCRRSCRSSERITAPSGALSAPSPRTPSSTRPTAARSSFALTVMEGASSSKSKTRGAASVPKTCRTSSISSIAARRRATARRG
jgi:K+-sensing histidine kinase KdpD